MVKTFRILNGLCPKIWVNKNPWSYDVDELKLLESRVKIAKMTLKIKVNEPHFQYRPKVSWGACLFPIWWFKLKSALIYCADKVKFTDRLMDRSRQQKIPLRLERAMGKTRSATPTVLWFFSPGNSRLISDTFKQHSKLYWTPDTFMTAS